MDVAFGGTLIQTPAVAFAGYGSFGITFYSGPDIIIPTSYDEKELNECGIPRTALEYNGPSGFSFFPSCQ